MPIEISRNREFDFEGGINNADEILDMNPRTLAVFMHDVEDQGQMNAFLDHAVQDDALVAHLSYWEKWFPEPIRKQIDEKVAEHRKSKESDPNALPLDLDKKFTPEELEILFSNKGAFQLTFGCSKGCKHCGFDAVPGVRDEMNFEQMENLFKRFGKQIGESEWMLYYASEPADSERYPDYHELMEHYGQYNPEIITAEGRKKEWTDYLVKTRAHVRMSLPEEGEHGYGRLNEQRRHYEIVQFEDKEIKILVGPRPSPYAGIMGHTQREGHRKYIGKSYVPEYEGKLKGQDTKGIGCIEGSLITPRGIYNVAQVNICEEFPQGQVVLPIRELSDKPIYIGQHLKEVLDTSIIDSSNKRISSPRYDIKIVLHRKDADYFIHADLNGFITEVKEISPEEKNERFSRSTDKQERESTYQEKRKEALANAKLVTKDDDPNLELVHQAVMNDPTLLPLKNGPKRSGGDQIWWKGQVLLDSAPAKTFTAHLTYEYDSGESELRIYDISAEIEKNKREQAEADEIKPGLVKYATKNIRAIIKKDGGIVSRSFKPFDYQKLVERIAELDFSLFKCDVSHSSYLPYDSYLISEFPDSLYEGQPKECRRESDKGLKDVIEIEFLKGEAIKIEIKTHHKQMDVKNPN